MGKRRTTSSTHDLFFVFSVGDIFFRVLVSSRRQENVIMKSTITGQSVTTVAPNITGRIPSDDATTNCMGSSA